MAADDKDMEDFKREVREDLRELTGSVSELTKAVGLMATTIAVSEEQKKTQERINQEHGLEIKNLNSRMSTIELERASERPFREFVSKNFAMIVLMTTLASAALLAAASKYGAGIIQ